MRKTAFWCLLLSGLALLASCNDEETYADQRNRERAAISKYIADSAVKVISEEEFLKDTATDVSKNEWVLFQTSGVYMQIIRRGSGQRIANGETATVLCRFVERNLETDSVQLTNQYGTYMGSPDVMSVTNNSGSFDGSFIKGHSSMYSVYGSGSTAVPSGWLVPLSFINIGRHFSEDADIARVRLIVPHEMGHNYAVSQVVPFLYDITYERGR